MVSVFVFPEQRVRDVQPVVQVQCHVNVLDVIGPTENQRREVMRVFERMRDYEGAPVAMPVIGHAEVVLPVDADYLNVSLAHVCLLGSSLYV